MYGQRPNAGWGYYRGQNMLYGGQGSGMGPVMAGSNAYAAGQGPGSTVSNPGGMHPSVIYMLVLVIVEMFVFAFIAKHI